MKTSHFPYARRHGVRGLPLVGGGPTETARQRGVLRTRGAASLPGWREQSPARVRWKLRSDVVFLEISNWRAAQ